MDFFTFIARQFCVSREMNKSSVKRLFEAMQMVPITRPMLQVTSALLEMFQRIYDRYQRIPKMSQKQS